MTEPTKFELGGLWDFSEWTIQYDQEVDDDIKRCPHAVLLGLKARWVVRRVVVAMNEGAFNSTGVCLDCILEAATSLASESTFEDLDGITCQSVLRCRSVLRFAPPLGNRACSLPREHSGNHLTAWGGKAVAWLGSDQ